MNTSYLNYIVYNLVKQGQQLWNGKVNMELHLMTTSHNGHKPINCFESNKISVVII